MFEGPFRMEAADDVDFRKSMNGRQPFEYLVDSEFEGAFLVLGAAEGAELAPVHTDIGRIYVAVDDEIGFLTVLYETFMESRPG